MTLYCKTCGRSGNRDDGIEEGGPCQEPCDGIIRAKGKEYHFGVVAHFDEESSTWKFEATYINGDDSPFSEMEWGEVYHEDAGDVWNPGWQRASMDSDDPIESANFNLLTEAIQVANRRLHG
jgi:hypothetical protein